MTYLEEEDHGLAERLEVVDIVDATVLLNIHKERHAENGKDEHDKEEKQTDIKQGWQWHGQGKQ